ncbi:MAG: hypothetical protein IPL46_20480 [Saprospiraceae bacterium]|nr:hypothetical protein [Saprospiraceae bacterium]
MKTQTQKISTLVILLGLSCFPVYIGADFEPRKLLDDQTIMDDLIVQGRSCIGPDCLDAEAFTIDELRIKRQKYKHSF